MIGRCYKCRIRSVLQPFEVKFMNKKRCLRLCCMCSADEWVMLPIPGRGAISHKLIPISEEQARVYENKVVHPFNKDELF